MGLSVNEFASRFIYQLVHEHIAAKTHDSLIEVNLRANSKNKLSTHCIADTKYHTATISQPYKKAKAVDEVISFVIANMPPLTRGSGYKLREPKKKKEKKKRQHISVSYLSHNPWRVYKRLLRFPPAANIDNMCLYTPPRTDQLRTSTDRQTDN